MLIRFAHAIMLSSGWSRRMIAMASGACGALAMAPFDFPPAMLVSMTVAVWLIDSGVDARARDSNSPSAYDKARAAFVDGWWLGFGYFLAGLWWLGAAFLVEPDKFAWALPIAILGMPAVLAIFTALGFLFARALWSPGRARVFALTAGLGASEWLRGVVFTGFPWNTIGMAFGGNLALAQTASFVGLYGLTFLAIAICASPATLVDAPTDAPARGSFTRAFFVPVALAGIAISVMFAFGVARLSRGAVSFVANVKMRIVQPNVPQDAKFRPENKDRILGQYLALSDRATSPATTGIGDVTHLVWPESAFPFILSQDAQSLARIGAMLGPSATLITGAARSEAAPVSGTGGRSGQTRYFNSIHVIGRGGAILDTYDKAHLVPFGEYLPFANLLEAAGLRQFVHIPGGFDSVPFRKGLTAPGLPPIAALVCYEAIFAGETLPNDGKAFEAGMILNVTNDGWFGVTTGPYQHLAQARLRAIEEGLPLVRSANTGISALIDPYGRILEKLPLGTEGVLDSALPKKIDPPFFSAHPYIGPAGFQLLALVLALGFRRRR